MEPEVAIIGMACHLPQAKNIHEFWNNLKKGSPAISPIPDERWDNKTFYSPHIGSANTTVANTAGLLDDIKNFDYKFFGIPFEEAKCIDPQTRLFLEETWHCIEDAALPLSHLQKCTTSVYFAVSAIDYFHHLSRADQIEPFAVTGAYPCMGAHRVSYFYNFQGESFSVDAACAASMVALNKAKISLQLKTCDYAVVGGANLICHPWHLVSLSKCRVLSADGQCRAFDKEATGYVRGEGVAVFLLTTKKRALKEGHRIHAILKSSVLGHSGKTRSISTPNPQAQTKVILSALKKAKMNPADIDYVEAHGTGTVLGDAIEFNALNKVFKTKTAVGSVKANIGHLEAASGLASLLKVILMIKEKLLLKQIHVKEFNPMLELETSKLFVPLKNLPWKKKKALFRASINSLGFGGLNTHAVVEEAKAVKRSKSSKLKSYPILLSAKSDGSLKNLCENFSHFSKTDAFSKYNLHDISYTLLNGREPFEKRFGCVVEKKEDLRFENLSTAKNEKNYALIVNEIASSVSIDLKKSERKELKALSRKELSQITPFLKSYTLGKWIMECLGNPKFISWEQKGEITALVLSGAITFRAGVEAILTKAKTVKGVYPKILLNSIEEMGIDFVFCRKIIKELERVRELDDIALVKVKKLMDSQYSLKKMIEAKNQVLEKYGVSVFETAKKSHREFCMRNFTLFSLLDALYQKYHIRLTIKSKYEVINKLREAVLQGLLSFEEVLEIIHIPNEKERLIMRMYNKQLPMTFDISLKKAPFFFEGPLVSLSSHAVCDIDSLTKKLVSLWVNGLDVSWTHFASLFLQGGKSVDLPNYPFESTPVWCQ